VQIGKVNKVATPCSALQIHRRASAGRASKLGVPAAISGALNTAQMRNRLRVAKR
jgi:hypothetical protein